MTMRLADLRRVIRENGLAILVGACLLAVIVGLNWVNGATTSHVGRVQGFRLVEVGKEGSVLHVFAKLDDGRVVILPLPNGAHCRVGSTLRVRETPFGLRIRFLADPRGCDVV